MENILPNGCCFADVTTIMCQAFLTIPLVLHILHSPFHSKKVNDRKSQADHQSGNTHKHWVIMKSSNVLVMN